MKVSITPAKDIYSSLRRNSIAARQTKAKESTSDVVTAQNDVGTSVPEAIDIAWPVNPAGE